MIPEYSVKLKIGDKKDFKMICLSLFLLGITISESISFSTKQKLKIV